MDKLTRQIKYIYWVMRNILRIEYRKKGNWGLSLPGLYKGGAKSLKELYIFCEYGK